MSKIFQIALREFLATVMTKGFILGMMATPVMLGIVIVFMPKLMNKKPPKIDGEVAILGSTGQLADSVRDYLAPESFAERRDEKEKQIEEQTPEQVRELTASSPAAQQVLDATLGDVPTIHVTQLDLSSDLEGEKELLREGETDEGGRLALAVVRNNAVQANADGVYGTYDLFIREGLDDRIVDAIQEGMRAAILSARIDAAELDRERIEALTRVGGVRPITVTEGGESRVDPGLRSILIPMGFMMLLFVSVFTGGQYLMTTTIEEKSSRVVEVLLSSVSPMQLMTGKIIGQMCVGLLVIGLYAGMGISALVTFTLFGLLEFHWLLYLIVSYVIAYFVLGSFMAAIGAAVNEPREAQSFMMPIMIVMIIPWALWPAITRDPNSVFATVTSFIPPINSFVMLLRVTSTTPPPMWQVWVSLLIGLASVYGALWFAAKVFRVGLLMHGKPPNFATLVKWVRMA